MHIIAIGEGYSDGLKKFEEHFHGREYANGKCKVRVREIKLYHFGFNECGYDEVLADIKSMARYKDHENKNTQKGTTTELHGKFQKYIRYFRRLFKGIKSIDEDLDKVKTGSFYKDMGSKGIWFNSTLIPIGRINDYRNSEDGREMV
jgi:hypothetical protein